MHNKTFVMSATVIVAAILTLMMVFSAEAVSAIASINLIGVCAAAFAAVVGFAWLIKKR